VAIFFRVIKTAKKAHRKLYFVHPKIPFRNKMKLTKLLIFIFISSLYPAVSAADEIYNADIRYLHVQKGQTLHNIVRRLYPERVKEWPKLTQDIIKLNPEAFVDNDPAKMKAGSQLKLPKRMVVRSTPARPLKLKKVGVVAENEGSVVAVDRRKVSRKLNKGDPVFLGDKVITGEDGYVRSP